MLRTSLRNCILLASCLAISACFKVKSEPEFALFNEQKIALEAYMEPGVLTTTLTVIIEKEVVIDAAEKAFYTGGEPETFASSWRGKPVRVILSAVNKPFSSYMKVDIYIDGQFVDTVVIA